MEGDREMSHIVRYKSATGEDTYVEAGSLDTALSMVERLRNEEGVSDVRVYKHMPIEFKTYYKVEIVDEGGAPAPAPAAESSAPAAAPEPAEAPPPPPPAAAPEPEEPEAAEPEAAEEPPPAPPASSEPPPGSMNLSPPPGSSSSGEGGEGEPPKKTLFSRG